MQGNETEKKVEPTAFIMEFAIPGNRVLIPPGLLRRVQTIFQKCCSKGQGMGIFLPVIAHETTEIRDKLKGCGASQVYEIVEILNMIM